MGGRCKEKKKFESFTHEIGIARAHKRSHKTPFPFTYAASGFNMLQVLSIDVCKIPVSHRMSCFGSTSSFSDLFLICVTVSKDIR